MVDRDVWFSTPMRQAAIYAFRTHGADPELARDLVILFDPVGYDTLVDPRNLDKRNLDKITQPTIIQYLGFIKFLRGQTSDALNCLEKAFRMRAAGRDPKLVDEERILLYPDKVQKILLSAAYDFPRLGIYRGILASGHIF